MSQEYKALYLLADSQLLFRDVANSPFIHSIQESLRSDQATITKAAYIGASNGDNPNFYELFTAAMDNINTHQCKMIRSAAPPEDRSFVESADLILLAGGDVELGWGVMKNTGLDKIVTERYFAGAVIVGVSAGAVQLGMGCLGGHDGVTLVETLRLCPYYISVHEEKSDWSHLKQLVQGRDDYSKGFGISAGGGMIYHPGAIVEPLQYPLCEIHELEGKLRSNILLPEHFPAERGRAAHESLNS